MSTTTIEERRAELEALVRQQEAAERTAERVRALQDERAAQETKLRHARIIGPDGKHRVELNNHAGFFLIDRSGRELEAEAKASIRAIDEQIAYTEEHGVPDPRAADGARHPLYGAFMIVDV